MTNLVVIMDVMNFYKQADYKPDPSLRWLEIVIALLCALGFIVSLVLVCAISKSSKMNKKLSTKFSANLLISSMLYTGIFFGTVIYTIQHSTILVNTDSFIDSLCAFGMAHGIAAALLALTRLVAMMFPMLYRKWDHYKKITICVIVGGWILAAIMVPLNMNLIRSSISVRSVFMILVISVPVITTWVCYIIMYCKVYISRRASSKQTSDQNRHITSKWQSGVTRALLASIITSVLCNAPFMIFAITKIMAEDSFDTMIPVIIYFMQHVLDPMLFFILARDYREAVIHFFKWLFCTKSLTCCQWNINARIKKAEHYNHHESDPEITEVPK